MTSGRTARSRGGRLLRASFLLLLAAPPSAGATERVFIVTASRFEFTPDLLEVEAGDRVRIALRSEDVTHGFAIEGYDVDVTIPASGEAVLVELVADRPGTFPFACSRYCGVGHEGMQGRLVVHPARASIEAARPRETEGASSRQPIETDYTIVNLSTTLPLRRHDFAFRVTHRFARPLGEGSFGDLASDLFSLDSGAQIGLGLRWGLTSTTQLHLYRTSDRTTQLSGQQSLLRQGEVPFGLALSASIEGLDNLREDYSPALGLVLSRRLGDRAALYASPSWVGHTNLGAAPEAGDDTFVLGLGARLRLTERLYVVGELSPRLAGFDERLLGGENDPLASFGLELRYGGHVFQLDVSNDIGTTPAQVARGTQGPDGWFLGFNISRKFF